jgi:tetratricopeptide (TPR) repeat protein
MAAFHKPRHRAILILAFAAVGISTVAWTVCKNPAINFLPGDRRAEWIVFPTAVDARGHGLAGVDATFHQEFVLNDQPANARLNVRAMQRAEIKLNRSPVAFRSPRNWKENTTLDVSNQLHAGSNDIEVRVFNKTGPPALWLTLIADQSTLRSDGTWEASIAGSVWYQAALASAAKIPCCGNPVAGGTGTFDALEKNWQFWLILVVIGCVVTATWNTLIKKSPAQRVELILVIAFAGLWLLLFCNNTRLLPFHTGFDSPAHLKYIDYIQTHRALPLPTEGWEMYQPPLYYLIGAGTLSACKLSIDDPASVIVLRLLGLFFGVSQFVLVFLSVRLLLPGRNALFGLLLAAFLPMHLYLAHYVTNELLAAVLVTLSLYLCLRLLKSQTPSASQFCWIGLALGAAMLAKATALLLLPIVVAAIAGRLISIRALIANSLRNLCLLLVVCFAVCGWYYMWIWAKFGTPLVGNWDVITGFRWWQDPGYHTLADYIYFGRSLTHPFFSSFARFADGIYSTLWGDGLCGGLSSLTLAWNQNAMAAGYLWSLIPTALVVAGSAIALVRFIRKPSSELFLLIGFSAVIAFALVFITLKVPNYSLAKAFYGLSILTPLCFFGATGWEAVTHRRARFRIVLGVIVLVWAMNSFAAYWIIPSEQQHLYAARTLARAGKIDLASVEAMRAVEANPAAAAARGFHALTLSELGHDEEAIKEAERAIEMSPADSAVHLQLAISVKRNDAERTIAEASRAIELGPQNAQAYEFLMNCLLKLRRYNEAAQVGREWLAVSPYELAPHSALASALFETGDVASAAQHLGYVMMLRPDLEQPEARLHQLLLSIARNPDGLQQLRDIVDNAPDSPRMLDQLAWLLATYPDSNPRDGAVAVRLAERACELTERRVPAILATLAAAYAEAGDFPRAAATGEEALSEARSLGDTDGIKLSENILASVRANVPYRYEPEQ